jgi:putative membrane protein
MTQNIITDFIEKKLAQPAEDASYEHVGQKDIAKGLIAGMIGGLVATAAKSVAERIYPNRPRSSQRKSPDTISPALRKPLPPNPSTGPSVPPPARPTARSPSSIPTPPAGTAPASA